MIEEAETEIKKLKAQIESLESQVRQVRIYLDLLFFLLT